MHNLEHNVDLTSLNTLHLKSTATNFFILNEIEQLEALQPLVRQFPQFFILGGGSNLVLPPVYQGLVIKNQLRGVQISAIGQDRIVTAMAGETWDDFVAHCCAQGAYGLENLSLIPGTVGASPIQNIGAYGVEVKDFIQEVLVYDLDHRQQVRLSNSDCNFTYRNSALKNNSRYVVISVTFRLSAIPKLNLNYGDVAKTLSAIANPSPDDLRKVIIQIRQSKLPDPNDLGNAGSFFHNPILRADQVDQLRIQYPNLPTFSTSEPKYTKISAGWLIDNLGLKGVRQGNIGIYTKQALVLVNYGGAYQAELLSFAEWIKSRVIEHYNVKLTIEPIIL